MGGSLTRDSVSVPLLQRIGWLCAGRVLPIRVIDAVRNPPPGASVSCADRSVEVEVT